MLQWLTGGRVRFETDRDDIFDYVSLVGFATWGLFFSALLQLSIGLCLVIVMGVILAHELGHVFAALLIRGEDITLKLTAVLADHPIELRPVNSLGGPVFHGVAAIAALLLVSAPWTAYIFMAAWFWDATEHDREAFREEVATIWRSYD